MEESYKQKYSIKKKLNHHLQSSKQNLSLTEIKPNSHHIYTPEHEGYFLRAVEKEIKHEGNLLRRIKAKINEFKDAKLKKKHIKNATSHYMQSMFSPSSKINQSGQRHYTIEQSATHSSLFHSSHRHIYSSNTTKRESSKGKLISFAYCKDRDLSESNHFNSRKKSHIVRGSRTEYAQKPNYEQICMKKGRKNSEENISAKSNLNTLSFSLNGTKPQWNIFECYRKCSAKKKENC